MSFGVGIGAFARGFERGDDLRARQEQREMERLDRERRIGYEAEDRAYQAEQRDNYRTDREFELAERSRGLEDRNKLDRISTQAREQFDEKVTSGEMDEGDFNQFWTTYAVPKMQAELIAQGNYEAASGLDQWGASNEAKEGSKLFSQSLLKLQTGDHEGALDDVVKLSKINGYLDSDFNVTDFDKVQDEAGNVLGYRLQMRRGNGDIIEQDVALDDLPQVVATFANPQAAYQSQMEARASQGDKRKKEQEQSLKDNKELRDAALKSILAEEKQNSDALLSAGEDAPTSFFDLSRPEQEEKLNQRGALISGTTSAGAIPQQQMVVDTQRGLGVDVPAAPALVQQPQQPQVEQLRRGLQPQNDNETPQLTEDGFLY